MKQAKISLINTTSGQRYLLCTSSKSKEFKNLKNAVKWAVNNGYKIERA